MLPVSLLNMAVSAEVSNANDSSSSLYLLRDVSLISSWVLVDIKRDLIKSNIECGQRGLKQSAKWAAELLYALDQVATTDMPPETFNITVTQEFLADYDRYVMAKSYLDLEEYDRAAHFTKTCKSPLAYFIHVYARYLAGEKRKVDDAVETTGPQDSSVNDHLKTLRFELQKKHKAGTLDGYCLYLYGVILKKLDLTNEAINILVEAVHAEPLHWGAWLELSQIITDRDMLNNLLLGDCWIRFFFVAQAYFEIQLNEDSLQIYETLSQRHFSRSTYLMAQTAMAFHNMRDVDRAIATFNQLQQIDPYRLDNMDTFSNLLYVKEMKAELAYLAHHCCEIDKYRVETCCVLGNYYSLRSQHEKAVLYFQRALKISPTYLCAWTLMGHEYMELKNTSAAIQAYRQAVEVNKRDYRAWYGLGQTYEILKMPFYCLYYYRQAQMLRPNDSRMVVALGEAYDNLGRLQEAKRCYWKARSLGDVEGLALIKLARLYEKLSENDQAAAAYTQYLNETSYSGMMPAAEDQAQAYKFIANYHLTARHLEEAYSAATRCTDFRETREEGKALLRQISQLRILESAPSLKGLPFEQRGARDEMDLGQSTIDSQSTPQFSMSSRTFSS